MPAYRFGPFLLDAARRELLRDGAAVELPPRAFDVIVYLLEHRERAVGRDELIAGAWGRVDVSDNVLDQIVLRARKALGDVAEPRRFIATRPRFGFAWVAPVEAIVREPRVDGPAPPSSASVPGDPARNAGTDTPAPAPAAASVLVGAPALAQSPALRRRGWLAFAAAVLVVVALAAAWWMQRGAAPRDTRVAILVLPLEVEPQADAAWARLGLMDFVAQRLREAGLDTLPGDHAVALLRGTAVPDDAAGLLALGERAEAAYVVAGSVGFAAGQWQVRLRALDTQAAATQGRDAAPRDAVDEVTGEASQRYEPTREATGEASQRRVATHEAMGEASQRRDAIHEATGEAPQPLDAARAAADALAAALGRVPPGVALPGDPALALQLQQIDAAVLGDALDTAQRLLDAMTASQRADPAARLRAATLDFRRGELDDAARGFEALLAEVSASDDPRLRGTVLNALGNLALRRNDPAGAEARSDEAIALLSRLPPSRELGRAWTGRAIARSTLQRHDDALADFARARMVLDGAGDRLGVARVDINVGILDAHRGRYAEAVPVLAAAADRLAAFNDLTNELYARVALARARLGLLEPAAARLEARRLGELVAREPNAERRRYADLARVEVLWANGGDAEADALLQAVRAQAGADADVVLLGWAQALAARHLLATDAAQAEREAEAALVAPWEEEGSRFFAEAWLTLVQARIALAGRAAGHAAREAGGDDARERVGEGIAAALQGFESWAQRKNDPAVEPALALARAEVAAATDPDAAGAAFERAIAAAEAARIPAEWLRAAGRHAGWLLQRGDAAQASAVAGRATAFAERDFDAALLAAGLHAALGQPEAARAALEQATRLAGERRVPGLDELATP